MAPDRQGEEIRGLLVRVLSRTLPRELDHRFLGLVDQEPNLVAGACGQQAVGHRVVGLVDVGFAVAQRAGMREAVRQCVDG
jgi:hypothetical protein